PVADELLDLPYVLLHPGGTHRGRGRGHPEKSIFHWASSPLFSRQRAAAKKFCVSPQAGVFLCQAPVSVRGGSSTGAGGSSTTGSGVGSTGTGVGSGSGTGV